MRIYIDLASLIQTRIRIDCLGWIWIRIGFKSWIRIRKSETLVYLMHEDTVVTCITFSLEEA
jgi:hypothetical protein